MTRTEERMMRNSPAADLVEWSTRLQIRAAIDNYATGLDTRDLARFLTAWHGDAVFEVDQPPALYTGHGELAEFAETSWERVMVHNHFVTNDIVELATEKATGICNAVAMLVSADNRYITAAAHYDDTYERRDGRWRITHRKARLNHWAEHPHAILSSAVLWAGVEG